MYDHIRFHTEEDYPENLPPENAATHIGMYWQWAAQAGLAKPPRRTSPSPKPLPSLPKPKLTKRRANPNPAHP